MTLSEKLYNLRRKQGLSQEALAEKLNCSRQVISKWENGTTSTDAEMLQKYSELFGVSIDNLILDENTIGRAVRYAIVVIFAIAIYPMSFKLFKRLEDRIESKKQKIG